MGLFNELEAESPRVDPLRRSLQRGYVDRLMSSLDDSGAGADDPSAQVQAILGATSTDLSDMRAAARMNLARLQGALDAAIPNTTDPATLAHLEDLRAQIASAGVAPASPASQGTAPVMGEETDAAQTEAGADQIAVTFACADDVAIDAVFDNANDTVTIDMNGETLTLPHVESGSGAKYSDGTTTFWAKGDEAFVQVNDETVIDGCVAQSQ